MKNQMENGVGKLLSNKFTFCIDFFSLLPVLPLNRNESIDILSSALAR